ncbi:MAG: ABC transporter permease [Chloroflexi bacterium]|nr:ABC transporter permease [Chloroflexota bacterium]
MTTTTATAGVLDIRAAEALPEEESQLQILARRFSRHRLAMVSLVVSLVIMLIALLAPVLAPYNPYEIDVSNTFAPLMAHSEVDSRIHYLGTDHLGRDILSRILFAARISLTAAFLSTLGSEIIGMIVGAISGYYRGWIDAVIMRFVEFMLTLPQLPLLLIISAILLQSPESIPIPGAVVQLMSWFMLIPPREAQLVIVVVSVLTAFGWLSTARLMRGMVLSLREQDFVEAARALGASDLRLIMRHMIPNALAPIIVDASLLLAGFVITESALSFLGFGIQDPTPTWGNMLNFAEAYMFEHPFLPLIPGTPIFICSLAFNFVGDGLRDALDPRLKL